MKFENPIMKISMFKLENVVTESSGSSYKTQADLSNAIKSTEAKAKAASTIIEFNLN